MFGMAACRERRPEPRPCGAGAVAAHGQDMVHAARAGATAEDAAGVRRQCNDALPSPPLVRDAAGGLHLSRASVTCHSPGSARQTALVPNAASAAPGRHCRDCAAGCMVIIDTPPPLPSTSRGKLQDDRLRMADVIYIYTRAHTRAHTRMHARTNARTHAHTHTRRMLTAARRRAVQEQEQGLRVAR